MSPKSKAPAVAFEWHTHAKLCDTSPHTCEWIKSTSSGFVCQEEVNVAVDTAGELWHKRLWHMSEKGMRRLADDNLIPEVKNVELENCTDCLAGKQNQPSFWSRPPIRWKEPLELLHTDVCQVNTKSHAGSQYFVTFIDDHSRKLCVCTWKTKDQVLSIFKELHTRAERETSRNLKVVRADNWGEYWGQFEEPKKDRMLKPNKIRIRFGWGTDWKNQWHKTKVGDTL